MDRTIGDRRFRPPLRARLHWYLLSSAELALLTAMAEHCSDGSAIFASVPRLAAYAKLSGRQVERLIHGYKDRRTGKRIVGLKERGILTELAPPNREKHRPATYQLNEKTLAIDPKMNRYLPPEVRCALAETSTKGTSRSSGDLDESSPMPDPLSPCREDSRHGVADGGPTAASPCRKSPDTVSNDSRTIDSTTRTKSKANQRNRIHHGDRELNSLPVWLALKEQLRNEVPAKEWDLWVRPMLLLRVYSGEQGKVKHLLAALPPNSRILEAAQVRLPLMRELLAPAGMSVSMTRYPNDWEIAEAKRRYGIDMAPGPWRERGEGAVAGGALAG